MTNGTHRIGDGGRSVEDTLVLLRRADMPLGIALDGPISDRVRPLAGRGEVGAQLMFHEDDGPLTTPPPAEWSPRSSRREVWVLRVVAAFIVLGMTVVAGALVLLWLDMRTQQAIQDGHPLPAFVVSHTPTTYGAPGPNGGPRG